MVLASNHTWGDKLENGFQGFFDFVPNVIGFLAVLVVGYFVAKALAGALARLLRRGGLDRTLTQGQGGRYVAKLTASPSRVLGRAAFWALFLGAVSLAVSVLGIEALTDFVGAIFAYLPNMIAAILIFVVAGAIAAGLGALVGRTIGETTTGNVVGRVAPILVMAIAAFMILDQLRIAEDIVRITYAALVGAMALALALAFGLGGRDVAARLLEGAYARGQASSDQIRRDLILGRERARRDAARARMAVAERVDGDEVAGPPLRAGFGDPTAPAVAGGAPSGTTTEDVTSEIEATGIAPPPPGRP